MHTNYSQQRCIHRQIKDIIQTHSKPVYTTTLNLKDKMHRETIEQGKSIKNKATRHMYWDW